MYKLNIQNIYIYTKYCDICCIVGIFFPDPSSFSATKQLSKVKLEVCSVGLHGPRTTLRPYAPAWHGRPKEGPPMMLYRMSQIVFFFSCFNF